MRTSWLKRHGNEADFLGFLQKLVPHESLTLPFEPFRFLLRIRGDIHIRKTTPRYHRYGELPTPLISDTGSCRLPASLIRGVADSPHHWYAESATPRITDTESRLLNFLKENSLYWWYGEYGESPTPRIVESESRQLRVLVIRGVTIWKKNLFSFDFQYFKQLKHACKGSFWPKISQGCNLLSKLYYLKFWK